MLLVIDFDDRFKESSDNRISVTRFKEVFVNYVEDKLDELARDSTETYEKNCRDFNYFMDDVKDLFVNGDLIKAPTDMLKKIWENHVDRNLPDLMKRTTKDTCVRVQHDYEKEYRDLRKELEDYCDEKNKKLKKLRKSDNYMNDCLDYNSWVNDKRNKFLIGMSKLDERKKKQYLRKSNSCDLNDLASLFLNMDCFKHRDVSGKPSSKGSDVKNIKKADNSENETVKDVNGNNSKGTSSNGGKDKSMKDTYDVGTSEDGPYDVDIPPVEEERARCKEGDDCFDVIDVLESHKNGVSPIDFDISVRCPLNYNGVYLKGNKLYKTTENKSSSNSEYPYSDNMDMGIIIDGDPYSASCFMPEEETSRRNFVQETGDGETGKGNFSLPESTNNEIINTEDTLYFSSPDGDRKNPLNFIYNLLRDSIMRTKNLFSVSGGNDINYISHNSHEAPTITRLETENTLAPKAEKYIFPNITDLIFHYPTSEHQNYESSSFGVSTSSAFIQENNNKRISTGSSEDEKIHNKKDEKPEKNIKENKIYSYFFNGILVFFIIFIMYQIFINQNSFLWFSDNDKKRRIIKRMQEKVYQKMRKSDISEKIPKDIVDMKPPKYNIINDRFIGNIYNLQYTNEIDEEIKEYIRFKDLVYEDEEKKKKKKYNDEYEKKDFEDNIINRDNDKIFWSKEREWKWKTIIEIHMEVLEDFKNEEWEQNKGDFLEICIEEFIKEDNEFNNNIKKSKDDLLINKNEDIYFSNVIEKQKRLWNKWIERHRYMIDKWKKEDWFCNLKETLKNEFEEKMDIGKESFLYENNREYGRNPYLEKQKIIWKRWIAKYVKHIDDYIISRHIYD